MRGRAAAALLVGLAVGWIVRPTVARADDEWLGRDKMLHFGASAAIAGGGYAASALVVDPAWARASAGAALALTAGAAKEAWDAAGHGDPSWKDATWDVVGTAVGVALAWIIDQYAVR